MQASQRTHRKHLREEVMLVFKCAQKRVGPISTSIYQRRRDNSKVMTNVKKLKEKNKFLTRNGTNTKSTEPAVTMYWKTIYGPLFTIYHNMSNSTSMLTRMFNVQCSVNVRPEPVEITLTVHVTKYNNYGLATRATRQ